jgi:hypothetical protein
MFPHLVESDVRKLMGEYEGEHAVLEKYRQECGIDDIFLQLGNMANTN